MNDNKTEDIDLIVNHPKKAINKLALPIIISNLFLMLNHIFLRKFVIISMNLETFIISIIQIIIHV